MHFIGSAVTDKGNVKQTNQDCACVRVGSCEQFGEIAMVVLCDGMGGLDKGELASATVIRAFCAWFDNTLPLCLAKLSWNELSGEWDRLVKEQNYLIGQFGKANNVNLGTTVTAMLCIGDNYQIIHIGDSRAYEINDSIRQMTEDQTFIAREIKNGNMTPEQAAKDPRRNMLLQCVGASRAIQPQLIRGRITKNTVFMFCSDGFRHVLTDEEMFLSFKPDNVTDVVNMEQNSKRLVESVKSRKERDNITVALLKCIV
ncbi:MAG: serine/threonine-protein phosphatase [Clostridia bacterium]|nr:serine/threonine-protein phosphatase [Clostridia bacterium]